MTESINIRAIEKHEFSFLEEMLYQAIFVADGEIRPNKNIIFIPELYPYIENFGRENDIAFIAETEGQLVGAIWTRLFEGYGFVDESTPELSMAVDVAFRGKGIGSRLLDRMLLELKKRNYRKVSLSVDKRNFAYQLYQKRGFQDYSVNENSVLMLKFF